MAETIKNKVLVEPLMAHFGLHADPFESSDKVFFEGAQRSHNIETLRHMSIFGDLVLLLTGEKGAGKSTLLKEFQRGCGKELQVISVDAEVLYSKSNINAYIIRAFAELMAVPHVSAEPLAQTSSRLIQKLDAHFKNEGVRTLLVVDNAQRIPKKEIELYFSIFSALAPESGVVILFSGLPSLIKLANQYKIADVDEWYHSISLKPFSSDEHLKYLQLRLESVGYQERLSLTDQQMKYLLELGKGLPGRINKVISSIVLEPGVLKVEVPKSNKITAQKVIVGLTALLFLSFLLVSYQHGLLGFGENKENLKGRPDSVDKPKEIEQSIDEDTLNAQRQKRLRILDLAIAKSTLPINTTHLAKSTITPDQTTAVKNSTLNAASSHGSVNDKLVSKTPTIDNKVISVAPSLEDSVSRAVEKIKPLNSASKGLVKEIISPKSIRKPPGKLKELGVIIKNGTKDGKKGEVKSSFYRDRKWAESQVSTNYTGQVLGSYNEQTALQFIGRVDREKNKLFYLKTRHKNKDWYVVFYGQYTTKKAAKSAIKKAPKLILMQKPWLRNFRGISMSYNNK